MTKTKTKTLVCLLAVASLLSGAALARDSAPAAVDANIAAAQDGGARAANAELALAEILPPAEPAPMSTLPEPAPIVFAAGGCSCQGCGSTGWKWGYGSSCAAAKADADAKVSAAASSICPGITCGINREYQACTTISANWFRQDSRASVTCKICPGLFC